MKAAEILLPAPVLAWDKEFSLPWITDVTGCEDDGMLEFFKCYESEQFSKWRL
jgi:hypothetical protein